MGWEDLSPSTFLVSIFSCLGDPIWARYNLNVCTHPSIDAFPFSVNLAESCSVYAALQPIQVEESNKLVFWFLRTMYYYIVQYSPQLCRLHLANIIFFNFLLVRACEVRLGYFHLLIVTVWWTLTQRRPMFTKP